MAEHRAGTVALIVVLVSLAVSVNISLAILARQLRVCEALTMYRAGRCLKAFSDSTSDAPDAVVVVLSAAEAVALTADAQREAQELAALAEKDAADKARKAKAAEDAAKRAQAAKEADAAKKALADAARAAAELEAARKAAAELAAAAAKLVQNAQVVQPTDRVAQPAAGSRSSDGILVTKFTSVRIGGWGVDSYGDGAPLKERAANALWTIVFDARKDQYRDQYNATNTSGEVYLGKTFVNIVSPDLKWCWYRDPDGYIKLKPSSAVRSADVGSPARLRILWKHGGEKSILNLTQFGFYVKLRFTNPGVSEIDVTPCSRGVAWTAVDSDPTYANRYRWHSYGISIDW